MLETTLKEGGRHVYAKRRFYTNEDAIDEGTIDEGTGQVAVIDHYDGSGHLWRVAEAYGMKYTNALVYC